MILIFLNLGVSVFCFAPPAQISKKSSAPSAPSASGPECWWPLVQFCGRCGRSSSTRSNVRFGRMAGMQYVHGVFAGCAAIVARS